MRVHVDPKDARPIWSQLEDQLRRLIGTGELAPGAALPSVRELARELVLNPATVARAYRELADAGWLTVRRGQGTFVDESAPRLDERERSGELAEGAERFAVLARSLGATREQALDELDRVWDSLDSTSGIALESPSESPFERASERTSEKGAER